MKEEVREGTSKVEAIDLAEAAMIFHKVYKNNSGHFARVET